MKKLLLSLLLIPAALFGAAGDIKISYKASNNVTWIDAILPKVNNALLGTDSAGLPIMITAGSGITITGGQISSAGGGGGVTSITGTANQVIASAATGAVTLSLPQSIATTSTVQFANIQAFQAGTHEPTTNISDSTASTAWTASNDGTTAVHLGVYGSTASGTHAGLPNANLLYLNTSGGAATGLLLETQNNTPVVIGVNDVEVGRFTSTGLNNAAIGATTRSTGAFTTGGFNTTFNLPNSAAPTTSTFGDLAADNNAWAASRGALQTFDGTANTYVIATLASDTPMNGQVPTWNTGGTVTWETVAGSSPLTTKGDLYSFSTVNGRLPIGTDTFVLTADSTQTFGMKWAAAGGTSGSNVTYTATGNGSTTAYTLPSSPANSAAVVSLNGINQTPTTDFSISGATLTFVAAPPSGYTIFAFYSAPAIGSGTVTNTGGSLVSNAVMLGAGGNDSKVVAGITTDGTSKLTLGVAGTSVGSVDFKNATSGTATLAPPTGALGTFQVTLPNAASTLPIFGQQITFAGPTAARTVTLPDAAFTVARTDAANTFTGVQTMTSAALTTPVIASGLTASGSGANTFASSTGTFITSTGANTLSGATTINDATTPSLTTASGKTNTGFVQINGKTSGSLKIITADATAQAVTITAAAQTTGATTLSIPDQAGTSRNFVFDTLTQTLTNKTLTSPTMTAPVLGTPTSGTLTNATGLPLTTGVTGVLPTANMLTQSTLSGTTPAMTFTAGAKVDLITLSGNTTFSASGMTAGYQYTLIITADASTRTLSFPAWTWLEGTPASIAATKVMRVDLYCTSTTAASVIAVYGVQQ